VGGPAGRAGAGEQRREQLRRHLGVVEHDSRPELDVRRQHAVGLACLQLGERGLLQGFRHLNARRAQLARGAAQDAGARVLGAVDAMPEPHQPLAAVQRVLDPALGVARALHPVKHLQHARRRAAVQRTGQRPDRRAQRRRDVGAGRGDDARGERRGVHPMLGRADPVRVDRLRVVWVRLAAPADQEALGDRAALVDVVLRDGRLPAAARRLRDERERHHRRARELVARGRGVDVDQLSEAPLGREHRQRALHVDARIARTDRERIWLGWRQARHVRAVDEQTPYLLERHRADELLDVDAAIAQRAAGAIGLGDLGGEGDDALEAGLHVGVGRAHACSSRFRGKTDRCSGWQDLVADGAAAPAAVPRRGRAA
jgi:hypothetical protein